ncbi:MAG: MerC domain-containing protein [Planctomycetota bacterium]
MSQSASPMAVAASAIEPRLAAPRSRWDRLGIIASLACVVHCLAAPFLLLLLPTLGSMWSHPAAHWVLAALVLPLAGVVVWRGYRLHRKRLALIAVGLGAVLIVAGLVLPALPAEGGTSASAASTASAESFEFGLVSHGIGEGGTAGAEPTCTESCCPSLTQDPETGSLAMSIPPAGIVTLVGSVLLVFAHGINLWGCRCFSQAAANGVGACGCPSNVA